MLGGECQSWCYQTSGGKLVGRALSAHTELKLPGNPWSRHYTITLCLCYIWTVTQIRPFKDDIEEN